MSQYEELQKTMESMREKFEKALPKQISIDKFMRTVIFAVSTNPDLLKADRNSFYRACLQSAQEGLLPDGKEAALVVYNKNIGTKQAKKYIKFVQFMPMVYGILKRARNSGEIKSITINVVYENDEFEYWVDSDGPNIKHKPVVFGDKGDAKGVYAMAITKDGAKYIDIMDKKDIEKVRNCSRSSNSGPWKDWWEEMAKKSIIRRIAKILPSSSDLDNVVKADDDFYDLGSPTETGGEPAAVESETPPSEKTKSSALNQAIGAATQKKEQPQTSQDAKTDEPPTPEPPFPENEIPI